MPQDEPDALALILQKLDRLERRVESIARVLDAPLADRAPARPNPRESEAPAEPPAEAPAEASSKVAVSPAPAFELAPPPHPRRSVPYEPVPPAVYVPPPSHAEHLERTLGMKWTAWLGALALVVGVGLAVKLAYDEGLLRAVPAAVRLVMAALVGFGMLAVGEFVHRRNNPPAAASLLGAGVAVLFIVAFVGNAYFDVYGAQVAFVLSAAVALLGAGVAALRRTLTTAVISLLGAGLAPLLTADAEASPAGLLAYLAGLELLALVLARFGPGHWRPVLRWLSLVIIAGWVGLLLVETASAWPAVPFLLAFALGYHADVLWADRRAGPGRQGAAGGFAGVVSGLLAVGLLACFAEASDGVRGGILAAMGVASLAVGLWLSRQAGVYLERGSADDASPARPFTALLAIAYQVHAAALLAAAVPVALSGPWVALAWAALGVAYALTATSWLHPVGVLLLVVATARWLVEGVLLDRAFPGAGGAGGVPVLFNASAGVGLGLAAAWAAAAWGGARHAAWRAGVAFAWVVSAALVLAVGTLEIDRAATTLAGLGRERDVFRQAGFSVWWALFGVGLVVVGFWRGLLAVRGVGLGLLGVVALKVVLVDLAVGNVGPGWRIVSFVALGVMLVVTSLLYGKLSREDGTEGG